MIPNVKNKLDKPIKLQSLKNKEIEKQAITDRSMNMKKILTKKN